MKTLKKNNKQTQEYKRVFDIVADHMVKNQGWEYCSKSEWKEKVRDTKPEKVAKNKAAKKKTNKKSKGKK